MPADAARALHVTLGRRSRARPIPSWRASPLSRLGSGPPRRELLARAGGPGPLLPAARLLDRRGRLLRGASRGARRAGRRPAPRCEELDGGGRRRRRRARRRPAGSAGSADAPCYRVAARDLGGAPVEDVMAELTAIAEACLARRRRGRRGGAGLAVIGMGKLGGAELNYSSDVDVLFVHGEAGAPTQQRAGARGRGRDRRCCPSPTAEGIALRVDADLRPEGRAGPLSRSLDAMVELLRAPRGDVGAAGAAEGAAGGRRPRRWAPRSSERVTPFVFPAVLPRRRRRGGPRVQGPHRGARPGAGQGGRRAQARPRRHPRRRVRRAAPPAGARRPRRAAARAEHAARARRRWPTRGSSAEPTPTPGRLVPVPPPARAPAADGARPPDARAAARTAAQLTPLARAMGLADADALLGRVRADDRRGPRPARAAVLPAAAGGVRRRPTPLRPGVGPRVHRGAARRRWGSPTRPPRTTLLARVVDPATRLGQGARRRCSR